MTAEGQIERGKGLLRLSRPFSRKDTQAGQFQNSVNLGQNIETAK